MTSSAVNSEILQPPEPKRQNLFSGLISNDVSPFDEDHDFLINTLYFTDGVENDESNLFTSALKRDYWLQESYPENLKSSTGPKFYLFKLVEFNKIAILEKSVTIRDEWWLTSSDPQSEKELKQISSCMTRLMRQKLLRDELRIELEEYEFEGRLQEQRALCSAIISLIRKIINTLYKKMVLFTQVKHKPPKSHQKNNVLEIWWKDCLQEQRAYINFAQKVAETYENLTTKSKFFRTFEFKIFGEVKFWGQLTSDSLFKGFFFLFVYKDFVVRDILQRINDQFQHVKQRRILAQLEHDYKVFMETDFTNWVNVLMKVEIFESYQSIVTPNEAGQVRQRGKNSQQVSEGANFLMLQKRYVKIFLQAHGRASNQLSFPFTSNYVTPYEPRSICLIDSDFDTEDEEFGDDIEEIISAKKQDVFSRFDNSSSDDAAQVEALPNFLYPKKKSDGKRGEYRDKKRKALAKSILEQNPFKMPFEHNFSQHNFDQQIFQKPILWQGTQMEKIQKKDDMSFVKQLADHFISQSSQIPQFNQDLENPAQEVQKQKKRKNRRRKNRKKKCTCEKEICECREVEKNKEESQGVNKGDCAQDEKKQVQSTVETPVLSAIDKTVVSLSQKRKGRLNVIEADGNGQPITGQKFQQKIKPQACRVTDSDAAFEELLQNFELRLSQAGQTRLCQSGEVSFKAADGLQLSQSRKLRPNVSKQWLEDIKRRQQSLSTKASSSSF